MQSIRDLRVKIRSIESIQQITKAMKMVAAARLKRAEEHLFAARPYARKIAEVTLDLVELNQWSFHPLIQPHDHQRRVLVMVFTGDRGLAGGFHQKVADGAVQFGRKFQNAELLYYSFGLKGLQRLRRNSIQLFRQYEHLVAGISRELVTGLAQEVFRLYREEAVDAVYLYYAKYVSPMQQRTKAFQLLPIDPAKRRGRKERGLFIFEPDETTIFEEIFPLYLESEMRRALLETETGELGARMTAMSSATDNAGDLIERYRLQYNRARQSQITTEIAEIIGGNEALKDTHS
jgi:F-type H+-transporting ATPase subunit gamma